MSDTPETDTELAELGFGYYTMGGLPTDAVSVEFARKLERERDEARELAANLEISLTAAIRSANVRQDEAEKAMAERDKLKSKYIQQNKDLGCEMMDPNGTIWDYASKLQHELNFTIRLSRTWEDDVKNISADRDYWKAEAERWRAIR